MNKKDEFKGLKNPKGAYAIDYSSAKIVAGTKFVPLKVSIEGHVEDILATRLIELSIAGLVDCDEQIHHVEKDKANENIRVQNFMNHIIEVCKLHGFSISHEDDQGSFVIEKYHDKLTGWFTNALTPTKLKDLEEEFNEKLK